MRGGRWTQKNRTALSHSPSNYSISLHCQNWRMYRETLPNCREDYLLTAEDILIDILLHNLQHGYSDSAAN